MLGLYVHIPFCRSRCIYCDFYSTTFEQHIGSYLAALRQELRQRRNEQPRARVHSIYIGGGTPSLLSASQLRSLLDDIRSLYDVAGDAEVTVEMNPDDVHKQLSGGVGESLGMNRVSLGVQTFDDQLLRFLRRRHDASTAVDAVKSLQAAGIGNISIDLIYGLPGQTMQMWEHDLDVALSLNVQHLSAYALSYETGTALHRMLQSGQVREADDELSVQMYQRLCQRAEAAGFEHYEISNFARPDFHSRHNSHYWTGEPYLGFGPGAHSYDGLRTRRANTPDLLQYLREPTFTEEHLTDNDLYDEAVMCGLRTRQGVDTAAIRSRFGEPRLHYLLQAAAPHIAAQRLAWSPDRTHLHLTPSSLMVSDDVMSDLMAAE